MPPMAMGAMSAAPAKAAKTFITAWPAMIAPASRTEWLTGRTMKEITSITARIGRSASGAEETQKRLRNEVPFFTKPTTTTVRNTAKAMTAVTAMCEVGLKLIGMSASALAKKMKRKSVKM